MRAADFEKLLSAEFQQIANTLSDGVFAAFLLGFDTTRLENQAKILAAKQISLADDDKLIEQIGDDDLNLQLRFDVPPKEAIDYFRRKRVVTKKVFNKLEREAKAAAFTVGGIYEEDILEAFKTEISKALETGQTQKFVIDKFKKILDGAGHKELGDYHLESIFRLAMRTAYITGLSSLINNDETNLLSAITESARKQLIIRIIILWKEKNLGLNFNSKELRQKRLEWTTKVLNLKQSCNSFTGLSIEQLKAILEKLR